jgi:nucleotide-binding universal stress UspA family protein
MLPKTVLFPIHVNQSDAEVLPAVEFCRSIDAHLSLLVIAIAPTPPMAADMAIASTGFVYDWAQQEAQARMDLNLRGQALKQALQPQGISFDVSVEFSPSGILDAAVGMRARYADIGLVMKQPNDPEGLREHVISGILFDAARPALITGNTEIPPLNNQNILIAWDGSIPASRAITAAIPILQNAKSVCVLCIDPDHSQAALGEAPGWDLAQWLTRHGIKVTITTLPDDGTSIATTIERHANEIGADLIIAGAYSHSRFRQRLFGGTTSKLLSDCKLPLLMAH